MVYPFDELLLFLWLALNRSSRPEVFCKKSVIWNFEKFAGTCARDSFLIKLQALGCSFILLKKRPWYRFFPVNFAKFLRISFFTERLWWPLLSKYIVCLKFHFSLHWKRTVPKYSKTTNNKQQQQQQQQNKQQSKAKRKTFSFVLDVDVEKPCFDAGLKIRYQQFLIFLCFMNIIIVNI